MFKVALDDDSLYSMSNVIGVNDSSSGMRANCINFGLKVFLKSIAVLIIVSSPKLLIFPIVSGYFSLKMLLYHFSLSTFYFFQEHLRL